MINYSLILINWSINILYSKKCYFLIANGLWDIGITSIEELKDKKPENLYEKVCAFKGEMIDKCVLYVYRCAVYYASNDNHDSELLKWWNWKDLKKNRKQ